MLAKFVIYEAGLYGLWSAWSMEGWGGEMYGGGWGGCMEKMPSSRLGATYIPIGQPEPIFLECLKLRILS